MDDQAPKAETLTPSIIRDHSPYSEANGPIVQQGFVAARVRAIQRNYHSSHQGMPHSPINPYLVPEWPRVINLPSPSNFSSAPRSSKNDRMQVITKKSSFPLLYNTTIETSSLATTDSKETANFAAETSALDTAGEGGTMILSPQAVPSSLAKPSEDWALSYREEGYLHESANSMPMLYPRPSVAAKLGSMVGKGWVGSDVSSKACNDQRSTNGTEITCRHQSQIEGSHEDALPLQTYLNTEKESHNHSRPQRSAHQASAFFEHSDPLCNQHSGQCKQCSGDKPSDHTEMHANMNGSQDHENAGRERSTPYCGEVQRTGSLQAEDFSKDRIDVQSKTEKTPWSRETNSQLFEWDHTSSEDKGLKLQQRIPKASLTDDSYGGRSESVAQSGEADCLSRTPSTKSSRPSRTSTVHQSKQPSWFAKLGGYKLVLVDKTPSIRDLSRSTSEPSMNIESRQQQHHHHHRHYQQPPRLMIVKDKVETVGKPLMPCEALPECGKRDAVTLEHKRLPEDEEPRQMKEGCKKLAGSLVSADLHAHRPDSLKGQRLSHPSHRENNMSTPKRGVCQASDTAGNASKTNDVPGASGAMPARATSEHVPEGVSRELPMQMPSPEAGRHPFSIQTPPRQYRSDGHPEELSQTFSWQTTGKGRGIKRVQVIVSLDGADDVNVEAILLKRLTKGSSRMAAHNMQDSEDWKVSNSSDQVLLRRRR